MEPTLPESVLESCAELRIRHLLQRLWLAVAAAALEAIGMRVVTTLKHQKHLVIGPIDHDMVRFFFITATVSTP